MTTNGRLGGSNWSLNWVVACFNDRYIMDNKGRNKNLRGGVYAKQCKKEKYPMAGSVIIGLRSFAALRMTGFGA